MVTREYLVNAPRRPWGDYGSVLFDGLGGTLGRIDGELQLERTGPFAPEITFPHQMVVRDSSRKKLEASSLQGYEFRPVRKARIVRSDWETWDRSTFRVPQRPKGGEPENYVLECLHEASVAAEMGDFWELFSNDKTEIKVDGGDKVTTLAELDRYSQALERRLAEYLNQPSDSDFYRALENWPLYVSERARDWFEREFPGAIQFVRISV